MNDRLLAPISALVALAVVTGLSLFEVGEQEFAVRMRFGQVQPGNYAPGLHWCWPFERIERIDRRVLTQPVQAEPFLDNAQLGLSVDIDLSWRVQDARTYLRAGAGADAEQAVATRLAGKLRTELKTSYAQLSLAQIVAAPRGGVPDVAIARLRHAASELGVELLDARVKRIDPSDDVANAIYARMQSGYSTQARQVRATGAAESDKLRADAERNRDEIIGAAERDAQRLRGEGDAQAAAIHARAYGANPEFAAFYRSLQAYRNVLGHEGDVLVIQPDGEFYKYLHNPARH